MSETIVRLRFTPSGFGNIPDSWIVKAVVTPDSPPPPRYEPNDDAPPGSRESDWRLPPGVEVVEDMPQSYRLTRGRYYLAILDQRGVPHLMEHGPLEPARP